MAEIRQAEEKMKTIVDQVIEYVQREREVTAQQLSSALAMTPKQAERIASMLEESGFVTIKYSLLNPGKTTIVSNMGQAKGKGDSGMLLKECVDQIILEMKENEKTLEQTETIVLERLRKVESLVSRLESGSKTGKKELDRLESELQAVNMLNAKLEDTAIDLERRLSAFGKNLKLLNRAKEKREGVVGKIRNVTGAIARKIARK